MILVDPAIWRWRGLRWAHLVSDSSHEELHAFAERLGLRRAWFQGDHYDVPAEVRERAIRLGAVAVDSRELVVRLTAAGLRKRKTRAPLVPAATSAHPAAMETRTAYAPGAPSWIDLATSDPDAAMAFYGALLGWDFDIGGEEVGRYVFCRLGGRAVAGLNGRPAPEGWPTAWTTYVAGDADADAARITAAGGTLVLGPADAGPAGRVVVARDASGAVFGVWQAGAHPGAEVTDEPGAVAWHELATPDAATARAFYGTVFGWAFEGAGGSDATRFLVAGRAVGALHEAPGVPPAWTPSFAVADLDAALVAVRDLGGRVVPQVASGPAGRRAHVTDPQGGAFVLSAAAAAG